MLRGDQLGRVQGLHQVPADKSNKTGILRYEINAGTWFEYKQYSTRVPLILDFSDIYNYEYRSERPIIFTVGE